MYENRELDNRKLKHAWYQQYKALQNSGDGIGDLKPGIPRGSATAKDGCPLGQQVGWYSYVRS